MRKNYLFKGNYAISEIIGGLLLIAIAIIVFGTLVYLQILNPNLDPIDDKIKLRGFVTISGKAVIEHIGGPSISNYEVLITQVDGTLINTTKYNNLVSPWSIGHYKYPLEDIGYGPLINESDEVKVIIYITGEDGNKFEVFNGNLKGPYSYSIPTSDEESMLISSLRNNTTDEDLICFNYTIEPLIDPTSYIYNWFINGNPISNIIIPFDTNITGQSTTKDYSGNENNGTINGTVWFENGIVGGAGYFDGDDDFILIPYCYDTSYIDEITVEMWIKTNSDNMVLASYDQEEYWAIGINNGVIRWSTTANGETYNLYGTTSVNNNNWHHIAVSYDSSSGDCAIFVDGVIDKNENCHNSGEELGSGSSPSGFIGSGNAGVFQGAWELLTYDDFEEGFGNYTDGGRDCMLYTDGIYAHQGSNSALIQDDSGEESSFYHTNAIDVDTPSYTSIKVDFWWLRNGNYWDWGEDEDWWVQYYNGTDWNTVLEINYPGGYAQDTWYHQIVYINETDYAFPTDMKIRFLCDATGDYDKVYIDQVYVNASGTIIVNNYSGVIDEFQIFKRRLTDEQIYQNYLCSRYGFSDKRVIVSDETVLGEIWKCIVTPNNGIQDDIAVESNTLQIVSYSGG